MNTTPYTVAELARQRTGKLSELAMSLHKSVSQFRLDEAKAKA